MKAEEIRANLNKRVRYVNEQMGIDADYLLSGAIFRKNDKGFYYQAELTSLKANKSIVICPLEQISAKE